MQAIPYASVMGSFMYVMSCTRLNIYFTLGTMSRYQSNLSPKHWITIKNILKYFRKTRNYILIFQNGKLIPREYIYLNFQSNKDSHQSTLGGNDHCFDDFLKKIPFFLVNRINNDFVN